MNVRCPLLAQTDITIKRLNVCFRPKAVRGGPFQCTSFCRYDALSLASGEAMRRREFITLLGVPHTETARGSDRPQTDIKDKI